MPILFSCPHCGRSTNVADEFAGQVGPCAGCGRTITIPGVAEAPEKESLPGPLVKPRKSSNAWLYLVLALGAFCLCGGGLLVVLVLPAARSAREAAHRMACTNNLKQIGLAMHNYHSVYGAFPAAYVTDANGKPMHSWRVALLPFLEQENLYRQYNFDEPWDSPDNLTAAQQMPAVFRCPTSSPGATGSNWTNYVVIVGDPTASPQQSVFLPNHWTKLGDIQDGSSNTLLVVETVNPVFWTCPDADPTYDQLVAQVEVGPSAIGSEHPGGANVVFADGAAQFLPLSLDPQIIRLMVQPADGQPLPAR